MATASGLGLEVTDETPSRRLEIGEIAAGQFVVQSVCFDHRLLDHFSSLARDRAPLHNDPRFARVAGFAGPIVQGLALTTRFSRLIGMYLPGEKAILEKIDFVFRHPVHAGEALLYRATVRRVLRPLGVVQLDLAIEGTGATRVSGNCQCLIR